MQWNFPPIKQRKEPTIHSIDASTRPTPVQQVKFKRKLFNRCRALNRIAYVSGTKTYYPKCYSLQKVRVNEYHNMVPGIFNKILRCYSDVRMPCLVHSTGFLCSAPNKGQWSTFCELYGSHGLTDVFGWSTGVRFFFIVPSCWLSQVNSLHQLCQSKYLIYNNLLILRFREVHSKLARCVPFDCRASTSMHGTRRLCASKSTANVRWNQKGTFFLFQCLAQPLCRLSTACYKQLFDHCSFNKLRFVHQSGRNILRQYGCKEPDNALYAQEPAQDQYRIPRMFFLILCCAAAD